MNREQERVDDGTDCHPLMGEKAHGSKGFFAYILLHVGNPDWMGRRR